MRKLKIFLSSVQKEFSKERKALKEYINTDPLLSRFFDIFLFEDIPATDRNADGIYLSEVENCDIYTALLGTQYGSEDSEGISPTHHEFNKATELGKNRLIFITDDDSRHPKVRNLISSISSQLIRRRFKNILELTAGLYASLVQYLENKHLIRSGPFDASICNTANINDISNDKIQWFLKQSRQERNFILKEETSVKNVLTHLRAS